MLTNGLALRIVMIIVMFLNIDNEAKAICATIAGGLSLVCDSIDKRG